MPRKNAHDNPHIDRQTNRQHVAEGNTTVCYDVVKLRDARWDRRRGT